MIKGSLQKNRNTYYVSFRIPDKNGNMKQKMISTGIKTERGNKRKAEEKMREILAKYEGLTTLDTDDFLLSSYMEGWVSRVKTKVQSTTYDGYVHMLRRHIKPYFDARKTNILNIKPKDLEEYYSVKLAEVLNPNTIIKHHAIIRTALQDAVKNAYIKTNAADFADKPKRVRAKHDFYTVEELQNLLEVSKGTVLELPIYLSVMFGLRRSEAVGLKWSAIDFKTKTLEVCTKVTRCNVDGKILDVVSDELKSESSHSTFYMNDTVCKYLKSVKAKQDNMNLSDEAREFVCIDEVGKRILADHVTHKFSKLLRENGLRHIRFHDLRHSCISLLVRNNFNMKLIQEYARHADFTLTANTYSHVELGAKKMEIDSITDALFPSDNSDYD